MGSNKVIDITGQTFHSWTVLSYSHKYPTSGNAYWTCRCSCGTISLVEGSRLRRGKTKQCKACHGKTMMRHIKYKQNTANDLYMIRCGPYVKIGVTDNIKVRLTSLQSSNPYPIQLVGFWKGEGYREEAWHKALVHCHHTGEWYKLGNSCELG